MIAVSPAVMAAGLINWDFLVLALTALGVLAWSRKHPGWAGVWWGLGVAAKLYPLLLLVPLAVLCFLSDDSRRSGWRWVARWAAGGGEPADLPAQPVRLAVLWTFNVDRGADWGSLWYALSLMGYEIPDAASPSQTWWRWWRERRRSARCSAGPAASPAGAGVSADDGAVPGRQQGLLAAVCALVAAVRGAGLTSWRYLDGKGTGRGGVLRGDLARC